MGTARVGGWALALALVIGIAGCGRRVSPPKAEPDVEHVDLSRIKFRFSEFPVKLMNRQTREVREFRVVLIIDGEVALATAKKELMLDTPPLNEWPLWEAFLQRVAVMYAREGRQIDRLFQAETAGPWETGEWVPADLAGEWDTRTGNLRLGGQTSDFTPAGADADWEKLDETNYDRWFTLLEDRTGLMKRFSQILKPPTTRRRCAGEN